jgi:peptide/nickel transport system substrate-binding protein
MNFKKISRRDFLTTAAMSGLAAAGSFGPFISAAEAAGGKTLNVRFYGSLDSLDPGYMVGGSPDYDVNWCINPSLLHFGYDSNGALTYRETAYIQSIKLRDSTHIDFTLTPGLIWSGGNGELTTEDVKFSFDRMAESEWKGNFGAYDSVDIKDKYNATIVLNKAFAPFMVTTLAAGTGTILCKKAVEAVGGKFTTKMPATCGPYLYKWKQKQYVKLTPNPEWTGPKPAYENINCIFISEDTAAALAYEAGEVDCTKIVPSTYERYLKNPPPNSKLAVAGALQYMWMGLNQDHPKLQDIRVRQAIQHAVDADSVNQGAYGGTAEPSFGVVCPGLLGKRNESNYSYDPAKAKALLAEAGVSGLELSIRTLNNSERVLAATIIQANLQAVGIKASILPQDSGPFWDMGQEKKGDVWKDLELWIMRYGSGADPYEPFQWFVRDQVGVWNWERWSDDEFEALYAEGIISSDPARRNEIYIRMQEIMEDTGCYVWLTHEAEVYVHRDNLDVDLAPSGETLMLYFKPA